MDAEAVNQQAMYNQSMRLGSGMDSAVMSLRLDTAKLHEELELYLKGYKISRTFDSNGRPTQIKVKLSEPLVNDEGVHDILGYVKKVVNPQVVQGNFAEIRRYDFHTTRFRKDFANMIFLKRADWKLAKSNMRALCDSVCDMVELYLSRPIGDRERLSYNNTIRTSESVVSSSKQGFFSGLFGRRR